MGNVLANRAFQKECHNEISHAAGAVESSTLASVGYDKAQFLLELEFRSGELYQYVGPPDHIYRELMTAESKGRFFNQNIRDHFPYVRLRRA